jgi:hypothetical protein
MDLLSVRQDHQVICSPFVKPKTWLGGMSDVEVLERHLRLTGEGVEVTLIHFNISLVSDDVVFEHAGIDLSEIKIDVGVEAKIDPVLLRWKQTSHEQSLGSPGEIHDAHRSRCLVCRLVTNGA